ncbi:MAG: CRISPR-associated protein Cas4 [Thermoplasmata archaeon]|nr:MAG: CRISPR-associated protein Cas4 [Thermoplasmata archaeon]
MTATEQNKTVSVSDVEKYGYCPLSWWLSEQKAMEDKEELKKGTRDHAKIGKDVKKIKVKEKVSQESERSVLWFSLISIVIGINGAAVIYSIAAPSSQGQAIMMLLSAIAMLWVIVAVIFFYIGVKMERKSRLLRDRPQAVDAVSDNDKAVGSLRPEVDWKKRFSEAKWTTLLFFIVSAILALHGFIILFSLGEFHSQFLSITFLILSLIWLFGSSFFFYISAKKELNLKEEGKKVPRGRGLNAFTGSEVSVILFAVVATIFASNSLAIFQNPNTDIGRIFLIIAVLWLYGGFIFLYRALRMNMRSRLLFDSQLKEAETIRSKLANKVGLTIDIDYESLDYERGVIWFAAIAMILALNAIIMNFSQNLRELYGALIAHIFEIVALLWLIGAFFFLFMVLRYSWVAKRLREEHGIDKGTIEYVDALDETTEMLVSEKHGLRGRPDYILKRDGKYVPVEVKTGRVPKGPLFSHILQLAAYCLLLEEKYGQTPPYGIIKYSDVPHEIEYTPELKNILISKLKDMREIIRTKEAHRNHNRLNKCKGCSRRNMCPEKLA